MTDALQKTCNLCRQSKPLTEFYRDRHRSPDGYMYRCKACDAQAQAQNPNREANRKRTAENRREFRNERARAKTKADRIAKYQERLLRENEIEEAYKRHRAARMLAKQTATPVWTTSEDRSRALQIYATSAMLQELTCTLYDVDHIVPLQAENVCGLHVWWNLQPIPRGINRQKNNLFDPTLYPDQGVVAFPDGSRAVRRAVHAAKNQLESDDDN